MTTNQTIAIVDDKGREVRIELLQDVDGRYRWYESATGADTEVSGATPEAAWEAAYAAWPNQEQWEA